MKRNRPESKKLHDAAPGPSFSNLSITKPCRFAATKLSAKKAGTSLRSSYKDHTENRRYRVFHS